MSKKWYSFFVVTDDAMTAGSGVGTAPPPVRAADLVSEPETAASEVPPAATPNADLSIVYEAAKITPPPHGYTVLKVAEMLQSEHIRTLPAEVRRKSVLVALDAAGVRVDDIVQDAVRRDRALDTYERVLQQNVDGLASAAAVENRQLEEEITQRVAELRARIDANLHRVAAEQTEFQAWRQRKQQEEAVIAEAVSHFVSENPITLAPGNDQRKGDSDVR